MSLLTRPYCRAVETYELRWMVRKKKDRLAPGGDESARARFAEAQSDMVQLADKASCKTWRQDAGVSVAPRAVARLRGA
jgi:hypothetical protein